jgi:hypothetical protein
MCLASHTSTARAVLQPSRNGLLPQHDTQAQRKECPCNAHMHGHSHAHHTQHIHTLRPPPARLTHREAVKASPQMVELLLQRCCPRAALAGLLLCVVQPEVVRANQPLADCVRRGSSAAASSATYAAAAGGRGAAWSGTFSATTATPKTAADPVEKSVRAAAAAVG